MKITLAQRHLFNDSKPMMQLDGLEYWVQWEECDLSDSPPYREKGSMTAHGKFPKYNYEDLPTTFMDSDLQYHDIDDIIAYKSS